VEWRRRRVPALTILVAAMLFLLPGLAVLQYRWLGQVSDAEHDRLQRSLRATTGEFVEQLDLELARAVVGLQIDIGSVRERAWSRYAEKYASWRAATLDPAVVREILLVEPDPADATSLRTLRWLPDAGRFEPVAWPGDLSDVHARLDREHAEFRSDADPVRSRIADMFSPDATLLLLPAMQLLPVPARGAAPGIEPGFAFTIVRFDRDVLERRIVPEVVSRYFSLPAGDYHLAIVTRDTPPRVVYESEPGDASALAPRADIDLPFFGFGPDRFGLVRRAASQLRSREQAAGGRLGESGRGDERRTFVFNVVGRREADRSPGRDGARWRLLVRHRAGSLDAAVGSARRRNLALGFGILVLLGASVALVAVAARRAQRLARQQIEFVAAVSHELRTPVAVIGAAADNLAQGVVQDPSRVRQYGTTIRAEARRLGDTVERVLEYAGLQAVQAVARRVPIAPADLVANAVAQSRACVDESGATIETICAADVPPVTGDPQGLESALRNLIVNAVKYGGTSPRVRISVERRGDTQVVIGVRDWGSGIAAADLPHVFEPFYRGADAVARQIRGNGLGLSIVKRIVEAHGGRVTAATTPGTGTTIEMWLRSAVVRDAVAGDSVRLADASGPIGAAR
jgi:signal transduction histidine kinase